MNYQYQYNKIINIAKDQKRSKNDGNYYENHHIIPKCLGGTNDDNNMILLTAREHYVVHKLLCRIYPKNRSLYYALHMMSICSSKNHKRDYVVSSRDYQWLRENKPDSWNKGKIGMCPQLSHDRNKGENNPMYGSKLSDEHKKKMTEARLHNILLNNIIHPNVSLTPSKYMRCKSMEEIEYLKATKKTKGFGMKKRRRDKVESYNVNPNKCKCCGAPLEYDRRANTYCSWDCYKANLYKKPA